MAAAIAAMLIAFVALIASQWFTAVPRCFCGFEHVTGASGLSPWSAWLLGIPWAEASGRKPHRSKLILNEFVAYVAFSGVSESLLISQAVVIFALCGFANLGAICWGLGAIAPAGEMTFPAWRWALIAATGNLMSASPDSFCHFRELPVNVGFRIRAVRERRLPLIDFSAANAPKAF